MGLLSDLFGKKPKIPSIQSLDTAQTKAVGSNITSFADIAQLATQVNTFNQEQLETMMERTLPGISDKVQGIISSQLRGEIPDDVRRSIVQGNSERYAGVFGGSQFARSDEARQLGLTSLGIINQGLSSAESWLAGAKAPNFDVTSMFITPQQQYASQVNQFERDLLAAKVKAAPDPGVRGMFDTGMQVLGMALSAYGGGAGYTGTYNPAQATAGSGFGGAGSANTNGPGGFYMGGNNWGFGRTMNQPGGGGGQWFLGKQPGKG